MDERRYGIVYEDDQLIVVDKPAGMLVIPTPKREINTLAALLNKELDGRGVEANAYPCHRIDRETSGLVLFAKGKAMQQKMMEQFAQRNVKKSYIAFAHGALPRESGTISSFVYNRNKCRSEEALTRYRVLERFKDFTVLEVEPVTGRTNQIRIHFKSIGHPLVGESVYAFRKDFRLKFRRTALHARTLEFTHPVKGDRMSFTVPLPADMKDLTGKR